MGVRFFFTLHVVRTVSGAHPASYPIGTAGHGHGVKLTTHLQPARIRGFIHPLPYTHSWRSSCLVKHRDFTLSIIIIIIIIIIILSSYLSRTFQVHSMRIQ
jgi:hypothetical protein